MNDQIPDTVEPGALERWEYEGGKYLTVMKLGSTTGDALSTQNTKRGWTNEIPGQNQNTETTS